jgi:hypothetical protein
MRPLSGQSTNWRKAMQNTIESDINITSIVNSVETEVVVNEVPVVDDVQVQGSVPAVVDGVVDPNAIVVDIEHV